MKLHYWDLYVTNVGISGVVCHLKCSTVLSICIQILSRESSTLSDSSYTVFLKLLDLSIHPHAKNEKKIVS